MGRIRKVSSKDVARLAGVSQATVSYVLNNTQGVKISDHTRQAVLAAAKKLNYIPNQCARGMRLKKAMSVAVVSDKDVSNTRFMSVLEGIKDVLADRNYSLTFCFSRWQDDHEAEHVQYFRANRIDGAIFVWAAVSESHLAYLIENEIPFVVIHSSPGFDRPNLVRSHLDSAILAAVADLKSKGADTVAFLGRARRSVRSRKYAGYLNALSHLGVTTPPESPLSTLADDSEAQIESALNEYVRKNSGLPQAVLCETVSMGFRLLRYAARNGIRVPQDLSVVAIGSSRFAPLSVPALSTIEGPLYEMGAAGCKMLFDIIEGHAPTTPVVLEWSYVPRESS